MTNHKSIVINVLDKLCFTVSLYDHSYTVMDLLIEMISCQEIKEINRKLFLDANYYREEGLGGY